MESVIACLQCAKRFRILPQQQGKAVRCPHCKATNIIDPAFLQAAETSSQEPDDSDLQVALRRNQPTFLADLATSVTDPFSREGDSPHRPDGMRFTHSAFAGRIAQIYRVLYGVAIVVQLYVLAITEWEQIASLPLKLSAPALVGLLLPAGFVFLIALWLTAAAHCIEYLARISAALGSRAHPSSDAQTE